LAQHKGRKMSEDIKAMMAGGWTALPQPDGTYIFMFADMGARLTMDEMKALIAKIKADFPEQT